MSIHFLCPFGHRLVVPDHRAGKKGRCPTCYQRVIVPVPNPAPSGKDKKDWDAPGITASAGGAGDMQAGLGFFDGAGQQIPQAPAGVPTAIPGQPNPYANPYPAAIPAAPQGPYPAAYPAQPTDVMFESLPSAPQGPYQQPQPQYPQPQYPQQPYPQQYPQQGQQPGQSPYGRQ